MAMVLSAGFIDGRIQLTGKDLNDEMFYIEVDNNLFRLEGNNYRMPFVPMKLLLKFIEEREELSIDLLAGM